MPQKLTQQQEQQQIQTLSPQQVLYVRLLEMPVTALQERIKTEMMDNPGLEDARNEEAAPGEVSLEGEPADAFSDGLSGGEFSRGPLRGDDDAPEPSQDSSFRKTGEFNESSTSLYEYLEEQAGCLSLNEQQMAIMEYLIGSLDGAGYLNKSIGNIVQELSIYHDMEVSEEEVEDMLTELQGFDPAGVGARDLQECMLLQLRRLEGERTKERRIAISIVQKYFDEFRRRNRKFFVKKFKLTDDGVARVFNILKRLNPKPGGAVENGAEIGETVTPDFVVETLENGKLAFYINNERIPKLCVSDTFTRMLNDYQKRKEKLNRSENEGFLYAKQKVESAQIFLNALEERQTTMRMVMAAILKKQARFFVDGDESSLQPLKLQDIADMTGLSISSVSRVNNSKYVQTDFGIFPLKYFFKDKFVTEEGEELSTIKIKAALKQLVRDEDKSSPLSDSKLTDLLKAQGLPVARRTVTKYREQLNIPKASLRR
jgi:RNA polymerase sigma-54 factor